MTKEEFIGKMPMAYTNNNVYQLEKDMKIRDIADKEYPQRPENRFTFENQKQATKEVTGEELTLEEFMEKIDK